MKYRYTYTTGKLEDSERDFFERNNKGWRCTGETLCEEYEAIDGSEAGGTTYVVMKGRFTRWGMCRDCGNHYIIARWDRYDRIDKVTFERTLDVEDR